MDGYRWFQYGTKLVPRSEPVVKKIHFSSVLPTGHDKRFKRQVFFLLHAKEPQTQNSVLIHYLGDEKIAVDHPHGNGKGDVKAFHRTCPSVLTNLASIKDLPSNVYKSTM